MTKRILLSLILWVGVVFSALGYDFSAVNEGKTIYYNITDAENHYVEVTYNTTSYNSYVGAIVVPSTVTYNDIVYTVTAVGNSAFRRSSNSAEGGRVTSVTLPSTILTIGDYAFYRGYTYLTSVNIPENVTSIGNNAFYLCSGLSSISIPNNVTSIGNNAFHQCSGLTSISIPNNVTSIGNEAFIYCSNATTLSIGSNVETIGNSAFKSCSQITSVTIPNSVTSIGESIFESCAKLASVTIGTGISTIPASAFKGCSASGFISITLPNNITAIGSSAFENCSYLATVNGSEVTTIGSNSFKKCTRLTTINLPKMSTIDTDAFYECTSLASLSIPSTVTSIATNPFQKCIALATITVDAGNTTYNSGSGNNCIIRTADNTLIVGCKTTTIPESVTSIGNSAFKEISTLTSITIPSPVTTISNDAFNGCTGLTSISLSGVTSIGNSAFNNCSKITTLALPNNVSSIGSNAFQSCNLSQLIIPASVTSIGNNAFRYNSNLSICYMMSTTPPNAGTLVFLKSGYSYSDANMPNIYVLSGNVDENTTIEQAYKAASIWSTWANKISSTISSDITFTTPVTIPNGGTLDMNSHTLTIGEGGSLTIEDGGQIILPEDASVNATVKRSVTGSSKGNAVWEAFASTINNPAIGSTNLITGTYDLYMYKESADKEWVNYKAHTSDFANLTNSRGYLYRNAATMDITIEGALNTSDISDYTLSRSGSDPSIIGFNFVGNPYQMDIYKGVAISNTYLETGYYVLVDGAWSVKNDDVAIAPGTGILVQAKDDGNGKNLNVTYTNASSKANHDNIMFTVGNSEYSDVTYAMFDEGHGLNKISHRNQDVPMLYIPQNDENFAIAMMSDDTKAFDLNFKAMTTGKYTLSCKTKGNYSYLHVIDRLTGEDVDMLLEGEYSFIASKQDNENRFIVRLEYSENPEGSENSTFAWQNGSDIIVNGEGELQIFDVMGRRVSTVRVSGETTITAPSMHGVYIFKLNDKTQKIVVK